MRDGKRRSLSKLPSVYDKRVFIGGSYQQDRRKLLSLLATAVKKAHFVPVIADEYKMSDDLIHDRTLYLLHGCRYAIFEASDASGALIEIERTRDYGTRTMILFHGASSAGWIASRMLSSFVMREDPMVKARNYMQHGSAAKRVEQWLTAMGRGQRQ